MLSLPPSTPSPDFILPCYADLPDVPPFPTRRSSDLPGCRLSKLPAANSTLFPVPSTFHGPKAIWAVGHTLRALPPLRVLVLVATPLPPLTSTLPPLNRPACQKPCPDTVMLRLPAPGT